MGSGGGKTKRRHANSSKRIVKRRAQLRNRIMDADQVFDVMSDPKKLAEWTKFDDTLPGCGQFFCPACTRYFVDEENLATHLKDKTHKRRIRELKVGSWLPEDADSCRMGAPDNGLTLPPKARLTAQDVFPELQKTSESDVSNMATAFADST